MSSSNADETAMCRGQIRSLCVASINQLSWEFSTLPDLSPQCQYDWALRCLVPLINWLRNQGRINRVCMCYLSFLLPTPSILTLPLKSCLLKGTAPPKIPYSRFRLNIENSADTFTLYRFSAEFCAKPCPIMITYSLFDLSSPPCFCLLSDCSNLQCPTSRKRLLTSSYPFKSNRHQTPRREDSIINVYLDGEHATCCHLY